MTRKDREAWTREDLLWWAGVWGSVMLAGAGLYVAAFRMPAAGWEFSGFLLNSSDPWGYLGFSRRFAEGGLLIDNPFAPAAADPAFFNLLWLLVGKAQAILGVGFLPVYYALGVVSSGLIYAALLAFAREFLGRGLRARIAYLLAGLGAGLGWVPALVSDQLVFRLQPFDFYHYEGFPVVAALFFPQLARKRMLLAWVAVGLCLVFSYPLLAFEAKLAQGLIVPLAVLGAGVVPGGAGGLPRRPSFCCSPPPPSSHPGASRWSPAGSSSPPPR